MSKTVSGATEANITNHNNLVTCFFVEQRTSGDIQGFVAHDKDITQDLASLGDTNGPIVYQAASSFIQTAISNTNTMTVDNLEVEGILDPSAFDIDDIDAGVYDRAEIKTFMVDWANLTLDPIALRRGHIGTISTAEKSFTAELRGMLQRYTDEIVELYAPTCRVDLGNVDRCKVRREPPLWTASTAYTLREARDAGTGSVVRPTAFNDRHFKCTTAGTSGGSEPSWDLTIGNTTADGSAVWTTEQALTIEVTVDTVTSNGEFSVVYSGDALDALLTGGLLTFLSGQNSRVPPIEVKTWDLATRTIVLFLPASFDVSGGDVIKIKAGCAKDRPACISFDNIYNAQAEFVVPGFKVLVRTPNAQ